MKIRTSGIHIVSSFDTMIIFISSDVLLILKIIKSKLGKTILLARLRSGLFLVFQIFNNVYGDNLY